MSDAARLGLHGRVIWAGATKDMRAVYNALDLATLTSSFGEGFANALGEAMACGVPCVATEVGDAKRILGKAGTIVPPRDPAALAAAWRATLNRLAQEGEALRAQARQRIVTQFSAEAMVAQSERYLLALVG